MTRVVVRVPNWLGDIVMAMPARFAASALANELVNSTARSKPPAVSARACASIARRPAPSSGTTPSTPGNAAQNAANGAGAASARWA